MIYETVRCKTCNKPIKTKRKKFKVESVFVEPSRYIQGGEYRSRDDKSDWIGGLYFYWGLAQFDSTGEEYPAYGRHYRDYCSKMYSRNIWFQGKRLNPRRLPK